MLFISNLVFLAAQSARGRCGLDVDPFPDAAASRENEEDVHARVDAVRRVEDVDCEVYGHRAVVNPGSDLCSGLFLSGPRLNELTVCSKMVYLQSTQTPTKMFSPAARENEKIAYLHRKRLLPDAPK